MKFTRRLIHQTILVQCPLLSRDDGYQLDPRLCVVRAEEQTS